MPARMAAVDAQFYWMSAKIPSDQFLLYAFAGEPDFDRAIEEVRFRARACPHLVMRVDDGSALTYPRWVPMSLGPTQLRRHRLDDDSWCGCLDAVVRLADDQLDVRRTPWRLHLFAPIRGIPGSSGAGTVAVLQVAHALADGALASALAGWLFGRTTPVPDVTPTTAGFLPWRALAAARAHRELLRETENGRLGHPVGSRPLLLTNTRPAGTRTVRTLVRQRTQLAGPTVTLTALAAISSALAKHLGDSAALLGAEVPMAKPGVRQAHNHFGNVTVGLYPDLPPADRIERIAADLANGRRRFEHRAARTGSRAFAAVPAPLLRWGVARFDVNARPNLVSGNTVVSSVYRGPADLRLGDAPVVLTAGYPALSPSMGLTHGIHGIGDTVAISVHAAESAVGDIDAYVRRLDAEL
ncbi:WS/DGAT domain-containing protein [Mycobacterium sp.]|uniref:WS/DGAT domain-containing protein n=1 Tax=Mycobacterium sp. TaxID=1785 RepID=UPI003D6C5585